ncbi:Tether containing UBX domain for GLUT4 [Beauveria bassiana]|uniref:UBX domain-containing protein n=1 Tax=Beauveria bassiana (strain ARSEF 2860) TaxID=655819 RepID=J5J9U8_BEAB2|nr:UBX domain-containing protein [Beauveria bassiana ARSEF 2860]EJP63023.1 UBX domain-containing protein [Beauveria bassiana ARSEF 2860]KAF1730180.1 Tether containing UBX domain for GLUT4 [Beauveria bassiana]KAH8707920.1 Tether containing UBX domain for GLUT4 [Beauveria bassiana]
MSTHVVVIASDLRRATIKVTPGTYLIDVLQEACKKLSISSDKYILKHKQKSVDLTVPFRTSGLVGGAKLELVQKSNTPSAVQIGLQLPQPEAKEIPGGRLIKKLPSNLTLWGVLRQLESGDASAGRNINITARGVAKTSPGTESGAGQLYYETPILNIMGRDYTTFQDFQKTLAQLGHNSGSVLIRLTFKTTDQTLFEAMEQIGQFFKETREEPSDPAAQPETPATAQEAQPAPVPVPVPDTTMTGAPPAAQETPEIVPTAAPVSESKDPFEPVSVYLAPSNSTPAAALAPAEESDFTPTIAHAKLHQSKLQQKARNKRLLSDKELEEQAADQQARVASIKSVLVKVRFPDNTSSDWQIDHTATGAFLHSAVRHVMADPTLPFHLVLPGSSGKNVIKDDAGPKHTLIAGYKLQGRVLVNLVWNDEVPPAKRKLPFLAANVAKQGQEIKVPEMPKYEAEEPVPAPKKDESAEGKKGSGDGKGSKVPKWLKLGKK